MGAGPVLSFGVPVRDAARHLPRLLDSLAAQEFGAFEVVLSDNASADGTAALCAERAARDGRFRLNRNAENIGQIENFNLVLELAHGRYFRWIGADDWLEPDYARLTVELLERRPEAVGATTLQDHFRDEGGRHFLVHRGERLDAADPVARFRRFLWFMTQDYGLIDPIYSLLRRDALLRTRRLQVIPRTDQVLAAELCLLGPFAHLDRCLSHRRREAFEKSRPEEICRRYHPERHRELGDSLPRAMLLFWGAVRCSGLAAGARARCLWPIVRFGAATLGRRLERRLERAAGRVRRLAGAEAKT